MPRSCRAWPHVTSVSSAAAACTPTARAASPIRGPGPCAPATRPTSPLQIDVEAQSAPAKALLSDVEAVPAPWPVHYGGQTAVNRDSLDALGTAMPYALALIALASFVVLFLFTGSVVLPLKALVLNTLSLSATFGAMVWVFQYGHFGSLFNDLTTTGHAGADDAAADVLPGLRVVDGLRGVPALAHPRGLAGVGPHGGRQHRGGRRRAWAAPGGSSPRRRC